MSKEDGNLIKTGMISIGSRIELWYLILLLRLFMRKKTTVNGTTVNRKPAKVLANIP